MGTDGNFYGTTVTGGASDWGTIFKITPSGELTSLYSFQFADGNTPVGGLVLGSDGNFYGTASRGGTLGLWHSICLYSASAARPHPWFPFPRRPAVHLPRGTVPVYSSSNTIQPGEWVSIYGSNLANGNATWSGNFPTLLGGTSVTINGKSAFLWYVSPGQINLQAPNDTAAGIVQVAVETAAGIATSTVTLAQFAPSFLLQDAKHVSGIILRSNGSGALGGGAYDILGPTGTSFGFPSVAARAGDTVTLFGVGFGPTNPAVPAGQAFSGSAPTTNSVQVLINNVSVTPTFAGLSSAGLYQLNVTIPAGAGTGDVSLQASVGGARTPAGVVISLQ